jgi:hypothetical protein
MNLMLPERLKFLSEFDNFYNNLVLDLKENKYNEAEFYLILTSKTKSMDRERRERKVLLNKEAKQGLKNRV